MTKVIGAVLGGVACFIAGAIIGMPDAAKEEAKGALNKMRDRVAKTTAKGEEVINKEAAEKSEEAK